MPTESGFAEALVAAFQEIDALLELPAFVDENEMDGLWFDWQEEDSKLIFQLI